MKYKDVHVIDVIAFELSEGRCVSPEVWLRNAVSRSLRREPGYILNP